MKQAYNITYLIDHTDFTLMAGYRARKSAGYYFTSEKDAEEFAKELRTLLEEAKNALDEAPNLPHAEVEKIVKGLIKPGLVPMIKSIDVYPINIHEEGDKPVLWYKNEYQGD